MTWRGISGAHSSRFSLPRSVGFAVVAGACAVLFGPVRFESAHLLALLLASGVAVVSVSHAWARVLLCVLLGTLVTLAVSYDRLAQRWSPSADGERVIATVHVDSLLRQTQGAIEFDARVVIEAPAPLARSLRARVRWNEAQWRGLQSGDSWRLMLRLSAPQAARNPGGFDDAKLALRERLDARATVISSWAGTERLASGGGWLLRTRARLAAQIRDFVVDRDAAALFAGLAVGATGGISREQWQVFSITGTTHLVAISGLHVTLFAWFAAGIARGVWRRIAALQQRVGREPFAALLGVTAALGYALLAGFEVPTQRTVVMLAVWWLLRLSGREQRGFEVLSLALLAVWLFDPLAPLAAGFWLSFTAMAILLLSDIVRERHAELVGWRGSLRNSLQVQWRVSVALIPATLAWFSSVSVAGVAVNLIAIPLFSFLLVPLVLLATGIQLFSSELAQWLWQFTEALYGVLWPPMLWIAEQPFSSWLTHASPLALISLSLAIPLWLLPVPWRWRGASLLLVLPLLWPSIAPKSLLPAAIPSGVARIQVLDGGDGVAVLVLTRRHTLVYDTAEVFGSEGRRAESLVLPALRAAGRSRIDRVVLSRAHGWRAAGVGRLLARTTLGEVIAGGLWPGAPPMVVPCSRQYRWRWDQVDFSTFAAPGEDRSCVLRISIPQGPSLLIPERVDAEEARALLASPELRAALAASVVLAPRRGSPAAVTKAFVDAIDPRWVIVAAAEHTERRERQLVHRWALSPERILSTATAGMIEIELAADTPARVRAGMAQQRSRLWQEP